MAEIVPIALVHRTDGTLGTGPNVLIAARLLTTTCSTSWFRLPVRVMSDSSVSGGANVKFIGKADDIKPR